MNPVVAATKAWSPIGASTSSTIRRVATTAAVRSTALRTSAAAGPRSAGLRFYTRPAITTTRTAATPCTNTLRRTLYSSTSSQRLTQTPSLTSSHFAPIIRRGFADKATTAATTTSSTSGTVVAAPQKAGFMDKIKQLVKQYGYTGVAVYLGISTLDLAATFVIVKAAGMDKIEKAQDWVIENVGHYFGYKPHPHTHTASAPGGTTTTGAAAVDLDKVDDEQVGAIYNKASGLWSVFVIAYGIHKLLVPLRVVATSMITPPLVKWLVRKGWIKEVAKKGAVASSGAVTAATATATKL